jgi:thioredoxin-related protein
MTMTVYRHVNRTPAGVFPLALMLLLLSILGQASLANEAPTGKFLGARSAEKPDWFKESFLEFEDDVAEAAAANKRVMLYFHQDGCPYCARLVEENFADPELKTYIIENFDGVSLNMWGDREVVSVAGQDFTEKTFAAALRVQYTPTLIFLDEKGQVALRLNGYYPPAHFRAALSYVAQKMETNMSFAEYRLDTLKGAGGGLHGEDFFLADNDLQQVLQNNARPLAVYFESANCAECETMHKRILSDAATRKLVQQASNVQFDIASQQQLTTPAGQQTTAAQWAQELGIAYTPSLVFFDTAGKQVMRIDAFLKTFHFQSVYAYVLERAYIETPEFQRYISARADHIREAGFDTDIWGYESFHD